MGIIFDVVSTLPGAGARLARIDENGVTFASHLDGSPRLLTPEISMQIQRQLGADLVLAFDECTSPLATEEYTRQALERTHRWAGRCLDVWSSSNQGVYGI